MAPTEGSGSGSRTAIQAWPERRWDCHRGTPT